MIYKCSKLALGVEVAHSVAQTHEVKFDLLGGFPTFEADLNAAGSRTGTFCFVDVDFGAYDVLVARDPLKSDVLSILRKLRDNKIHHFWLSGSSVVLSSCPEILVA